MTHPSIISRSAPARIAYEMAGSGDTLSFGELDQRSNRIAQALRKLGVGPGGNIALLSENSLDFVALTWGAQRCGVFYTAVSCRLTLTEIIYIVDDCGASVLVLSARYSELLVPIQSACPDVQILVSGVGEDFGPSWDSLERSMPAVPVDDEAAGADLLYSSGTTGRPKGVARSFKMQPIDTVIPPLMTVLCETMAGMNEKSVYLSPAPLYHAAPLRTSMMAVKLGGKSIIMEQFGAAKMLELIEKHRVTHTQVVPTMFVRMLRLPQEKRDAHDLSSLEIIFHAAAPCPREVKRQMLEWVGPILIEYYAGSEANGVTVSKSEDWLKYPGTVGRSLIGDIVVVDEHGTPLPAGEMGHIYFDSGIEFSYRGDAGKTEKAYLRPGCSTLGDVGYVNEDGFLFLTDRAAYTIISGGVNIYPQETEDMLACHLQVADVAVFGVPDEEMGEQVKAVVQLEDGIEPSPDKATELIEYCRAHLSRIKAPKSIDFRKELPRTPTGKLTKRKLKDEYWP